MPTYVYACKNCEHQFEIFQSFSDNALRTCPECKKRKLNKVLFPARVGFKGPGFYVNDSATASASTATSSEGGSSTDSSSSGSSSTPASSSSSSGSSSKNSSSGSSSSGSSSSGSSSSGND